MSDCPCLDCVAHHPPAPPDPGRPGWTADPDGYRKRNVPPGIHLAVMPRSSGGWAWVVGDAATGVAAGHEEAQLAAERKAVRLLREVADELARGLPEARFCEHCGDAPTCAACGRDDRPALIAAAIGVEPVPEGSR